MEKLNSSDKKKILIAGICLITVVIGAVIGVFFARGGLSKGNNGNETASETESVSDTENTLSREKTALPLTVVAGVCAVTDEPDAEMLGKAKENGFNSIIFSTSPTDLPKAAQSIKAAKEKEFYTGVITDAADEEALKSFVRENNADFIILSGKDESDENCFTDINNLCSVLRNIDSGLRIGFRPSLITRLSDSVTKLTDSAIIDFIYIEEPGMDLKSLDKARQTYSESTAEVWICHNLSYIDTYAVSDAQKIIESISQSEQLDNCKALVFSPLDGIISADSDTAAMIKNYIIDKENYYENKDFAITNYDKKEITVETSTITFRGTSSPLYSLECNGKKMETADNGDFSVDVKLNMGQNKIFFQHKDKTYTYVVTYKIKLLKDVSPSKSVTVPGKIEVEVTAIAYRDAEVTVSFNGKTYKMKSSAGEEKGDKSPDSTSDFISYYYNLPTPAGKSEKQNLGSFNVTAKYKGMTESMKGANVTVSAEEPVTVTPEEPTATVPPETTEPSTAETTTERSSKHTTRPPRVTLSTSTSAPDVSDQSGSEGSTSQTTTTTTRSRQATRSCTARKT